jgi:hypothetical protein
MGPREQRVADRNHRYDALDHEDHTGEIEVGPERRRRRRRRRTRRGHRFVELAVSVGDMLLTGIVMLVVILVGFLILKSL